MNNIPLHALLIGISAYPPVEALSGQSGDPSLPGPVHDVARMKSLLTEVGAEITTLTATPTDDGRAVESPNDLPTRENVIAALDRLATLPVEQPILVYYAGHGAQVESDLSPEIRGSRFDECLVLADGAQLRDFELAPLFRALAAGNRRATLILDCCHSGGIVRGVRSRRRGLGRIVATDPLPADRIAELAAEWRRHSPPPAEQRRFRDLTGRLGWLEQCHLTAFAASRLHQSALETTFDDGPGGWLTYWLIDGLRRQHDLTDVALFEHIRCHLGNRGARQYPVLTGGRRRPILFDGPGTDFIARPLQVVNVSAHLARIDGGAVHGLETGQRVRIGSGKERVVCEIIDCQPMCADVKRVEGARGEVETGMVVVPLDLATRIDVAVDQPAERRRELAASLQTRALAEPLVRIVEAPERDGTVDLQLEVDDDGGFEISRGETTLLTRRSAKAGELRRVLDHMARYFNVDRLTPPVYRAESLDAEIEVGWVELPDDFVPEDDTAPDHDFARGDKVDFERTVDLHQHLRVEVGTWIGLRIQNRSPETLEVTVLDLCPDWSLVRIHPPPEIGSTVSIPAGGRLQVPLQAGLPPALASGVDRVKIFATEDPTSYDFLRLPALSDTDFRARTPPMRSVRGLGHRLGALRGLSTMRSFEAGRWTVKTLTVEVFTPGCDDTMTA